MHVLCAALCVQKMEKQKLEQNRLDLEALLEAAKQQPGAYRSALSLQQHVELEEVLSVENQPEELEELQQQQQQEQEMQLGPLPQLFYNLRYDEAPAKPSAAAQRAAELQAKEVRSALVHCCSVAFVGSMLSMDTMLSVTWQRYH